jgi:hypothetical protein
MDLAQLICRNLKSKAYNYTCHPQTKDLIEVCYRLTVPRWVEDSSLVKNSQQHVLYFGNSKKGIAQYKVDLNSLGQVFPRVTNSKAFIESRVYSIDELSKVGDLNMYLSTQREKIFREVRSNIILEQIGNLTQKWNHVSDGKYFHDQKDPKNYPRVYPVIHHKPRVKDLSNDSLPF